MMLQAYLIFRSVTGGQRAKAALDRSGIASRLQRSPRQIAENGCAYALTVSGRDLDVTRQLLRRERIAPSSVYIRRTDGSFERGSE